MTTFTNQSKNSSTFLNILRHGKATIVNDLANFNFNDVVFADGTILKNVTFDQLVEQVWTNANKNYQGAMADFARADYAIVGTTYGWTTLTRN